MLRQRILLLLCLLLLASSSEVAAIDVLFLGDNGHHKPKSLYDTLRPMFTEQEIAVTYSEDPNVLNLRQLEKYDVLLIYANINRISEEQEKAILAYVASGGGYVPIHCASYCFIDQPELIKLTGAQFRHHGTGVFRVEQADVRHPILAGYEGFESWDETYLHHMHNEQNRLVLEYRTGPPQAPGNKREPWTWVRDHGQGRVFYTAWGHDERTWNQPGFHDLLIRGIRWAAATATTSATLAITENDSHNSPENTAFPALRPLPDNLKPFKYVDVGPKIPNYAAGNGETLNLMQLPLPTDESMQHIATPARFHLELFVDETTLGAKPITMNWDERGRLWVAETRDYPNEIVRADEGKTGNDQIRILEDTDGDGLADKSTLFAKDLSVPTAIAFHRGGAVVQTGTQTLYLKDTDGDDRADQRIVLLDGWGIYDTHAGVSNFRNGLDNSIWGMQGYNNSKPEVAGKEDQSFSSGFFRFRLSQTDPPHVESMEFLRSTPGNTWGLGISEEGLIFGSTANRNPSFFLPIANRYYEKVRGWSPEPLRMIADTHHFQAITDKVRQVDHHGGYTAAAGHALYTARNYPRNWWNRTAFVCAPTGHLVGVFELLRDGASYRSHNPINLFASDDEWSAPIMAEVGPDGNVWVIDWYNYIVQHNPTPQGFNNGKGNAYETDLRDKKYGRIYRVVYDAKQDAPLPAPLTSNSTTGELLAGLRNQAMRARLSAQRLLVERGTRDCESELIELVNDRSVDEIGLNPPAIHALHTLHGLGAIDQDDSPAAIAARHALSHPSPGVRRNAIEVLPETAQTASALLVTGSLGDEDPQVRLAACLKFADLPPFERGGESLVMAAVDARNRGDRWLMDGLTSAAATHAASFLDQALRADITPHEEFSLLLRRVAEHVARSAPASEEVDDIVQALANGNRHFSNEMIIGMKAGWPKEYRLDSNNFADDDLRTILRDLESQHAASLLQLSRQWATNALQTEIPAIRDELISLLADVDAEMPVRVASAKNLLDIASDSNDALDALFEVIGPQMSKEDSDAFLDVLKTSHAPGINDRLVTLASAGTPTLRDAAIRILLSRPDRTNRLLTSLADGVLRLNDLSLQQRDALRRHPEAKIRQRFGDILKNSDAVVTTDRQELLRSKLHLTEQTGDPLLGKEIFTKNCAVCHVFKGEGKVVGPNLNGMSVHPKAELLTHILDPNRSVEGNYRNYTLLTNDGLVINGLLATETRTSIGMVDAEGKEHTILREDIDELLPSAKSVMPEGLEKTINDAGLVNLLEYLTQHERYIPLGLQGVANFNSSDSHGSRQPDTEEGETTAIGWGKQEFAGVPFELLDPASDLGMNAIMLQGRWGRHPRRMPESVNIRCRLAASHLHILGGVAEFGAEAPGDKGTSLIVRLHYADGDVEDHPLVDGVHLANYRGKYDVPESEPAFSSKGSQIRYLKITPGSRKTIDTIELKKADHHSAPITFAITAEL